VCKMSTIPLTKRGFRVLGIAESFDRKRSPISVVAGIVMRRDLLIDGVRVRTVPIGGKHITKTLIDLFTAFNRSDIRAILLQGAVISWFNIVDLELLHRTTRLPILSVTYDPSHGLEKYLEEYFPDDYEYRIEQYKKLGPRRQYMLKTGYKLYLYNSGMTWSEAGQLIDAFTLQGRIPEPIRIAQLIAREFFSGLL